MLFFAAKLNREKSCGWICCEIPLFFFLNFRNKVFKCRSQRETSLEANKSIKLTDYLEAAFTRNLMESSRKCVTWWIINLVRGIEQVTRMWSWTTQNIMIDAAIGHVENCGCVWSGGLRSSNKQNLCENFMWRQIELLLTVFSSTHERAINKRHKTHFLLSRKLTSTLEWKIKIVSGGTNSNATEKDYRRKRNTRNEFIKAKRRILERVWKMTRYYWVKCKHS
jgi:hypothetical protein